MISIADISAADASRTLATTRIAVFGLIEIPWPGILDASAGPVKRKPPLRATPKSWALLQRSDCVVSQAFWGCHFCWVLNRAFRMTSNLRMQAVRATLAFLPAARRR